MRQPDQTAKGFFGALFDFSFKSYVTPKIIRIVFGVVIIVAALAALGIIITGFAQSVILGIVFLLIVGPLVFLFYVIIARVYLEVVMAVFTIAENTTRLAQAGSPGFGPPPSQPSPFGPQPAQPPPSYGQRPAQPPSSGFGPPPVPPSGASLSPPPAPEPPSPEPPAPGQSPPWLPPPADS